MEDLKPLDKEETPEAFRDRIAVALADIKPELPHGKEIHGACLQICQCNPFAASTAQWLDGEVRRLVRAVKAETVAPSQATVSKKTAKTKG